MSNELQQKYPKFYAKPHLWIDAIEVERIKGYVNPFQPKKDTPIWMEVGEKYKLNVVTVLCMNERNLWDNYKPLFKPQEGEAFIKDLESAVSAATGKKYLYREEKHGQHILNTGTSPEDKVVRMPIINLALVKGYELESGIRLDYFDTAAYVDKLRELGYYL